MIADHSSIGSSELFIPVSLGNGKIALQTVGSNRFVCAENSGAAPLVADRLSQGAWEIFQLAGAGLAAPEGFTATAGNATVLLTWNPVGGATSYSVKRATTSGGPFIQIATPIGYNYTDSGAIGVTCYYVVSASDSAGAGSPNSTEVAAMPQPLVTQQSPEFNLQEITRSSQFSFTGNAGALTYKSSVAGHTYQMQNSNSMADGSWKDAGDPQPGTGGGLQFAIPSAPPFPRRFFRFVIRR